MHLTHKIGSVCALPIVKRLNGNFRLKGTFAQHQSGLSVFSLDSYQLYSLVTTDLWYQILMNARVLHVSTKECVLIKLAHIPVSALLVFQVESVRLVSTRYLVLKYE